MKTLEVLSPKDIKDYKQYIQKKYASKSIREKNNSIDELIDIILIYEKDITFCNIEELEFIKLEAQTVAEMLLR
jgi:hypothetical protein